MEMKAVSKSVRISPRKVRIVADLIRGLSASNASNVLALADKRGASVLGKTLKSAIANAIHNNKLSPDTLYVKRVEVTEGPFLKRFRPSTRGRVHPYKKRSSHIRIVIEEKGGNSNGAKS